MSNKGNITVFMSLMLLVLLGLALAVMQVVSLRCAKTMAITAADSGASGILADYNPYIYSRYHILLLDKNYEGLGEGQIEALVQENLEYSLSDRFTVNSVELSGTTGIMDNGCQEFKNQIEEYAAYGLTENVVDKLLEKTGANDEPVQDSVLEQMDQDVSETEQTEEEAEFGSNMAENASGIGEGDTEGTESEAGEGSVTGTGSETGEGTAARSASKTEDPRTKVKIWSKLGIAFFIQPEELELSDNVVDLSNLPSYGRTGIAAVASVAADFSDYDRLKQDVTAENGWGSGLYDNALAIAYAADVFGCATNQKEDTYLNCELEYLICGCSTDGENYKKAVDRIVALRLGVNYAYLLTDASKMSQVSTLAWELSLITLVPQPILKYLLAGCWAYIEGVAEVYFLLRGEEIPYVKNAENWITDLDALSNLSSLEKPETDEAGMDYQDYLLLLLAFQGDILYYRMLDLIEVNTQTQYADFEMENAITEFGLNISVSYQGEEITIRKEKAY
jgi:hypothetical protein